MLTPPGDGKTRANAIFDVPSCPSCPGSLILLFSSQTYSFNDQSAWRVRAREDVHGCRYVFGSSIVTSYAIVSGPVRRYFSTTCSASLCWWPSVSTQVLSLKPTASTTSVSPSHLPTESPMNVASRSAG